MNNISIIDIGNELRIGKNLNLKLPIKNLNFDHLNYIQYMINNYD